MTEEIFDVVNERDLKTKEWRLRPGMTASVNLILRTHPAAWKVPTTGIARGIYRWRGAANKFVAI